MRKKREETFISIKDVAEKADVSIATVSRVINNGKVSEPRKIRVLEAIKELNYVPNSSARNLASVNQTKRVKMIVPNIEQNCYTEMIKGFKTGTKIYGFDPVIDDYDCNEITYEKLNNELLASSEVKCVIQIGFMQELANKIIVNLDDELLEITPASEYMGKKIGIYFPKDAFLTSFFMNNIFATENTIDVSTDHSEECDYYICQSTEQAAYLINAGINKKIYVLERVPNIEELISNIHSLPIDFFAVGLTLSRIAIKKVMGKLSEDDASLVLPITWRG